MPTYRVVIALVLVSALATTTTRLGAEPFSPPSRLHDGRPITLPDILAWKSIRGRVISANGEWLAYVLQPNEGDSQVVLRFLEGDAEHRFDIGEQPAFGSASQLAFSDDGNWFAYEIRPSRDMAAQAAKSKEKTSSSAGLVELATGEMNEFEDVQSFAFGGRDTVWLALHRIAPASREGDTEKWKGTDLLLRRVSDGATLTLGNVSEFAFNDDGSALATAIDTRERAGNGMQLRQIATGRVIPLDSGAASYEHLAWAEQGDALAALKGVDSEAHRNDLYSVLGFTDLDAATPTRVSYEPASDEGFPQGMTINPNHAPAWNEARDALVFRIHEAELEDVAGADADDSEGPDDTQSTPDAEEAISADDEDLDTADLVIWHWRDRRLQSRQQVQQEGDRNFGYLSTYLVNEQRFIQLANEEVRNLDPAPQERFAIGHDNDVYERMGNLDGQRYVDVWVADMATGASRLALEKKRWVYDASPDGSRLLYFDDGNFWTLDLASGATVNVTGAAPTTFWNTEDDHNIVKPPIRQSGLGWSSDGEHLLLYDNWDLWKIAADGSSATNLTQDGRDQQIRYGSVFQFDPDADGIDLSQPLYVTAYGEWTKKGGIGRIDPDRPGVEMLLWDDAAFDTLIKADDADVYLYTRETHDQAPDGWVTGADLVDGRRVTDANPQQADHSWSAGVRLLDYTSAKGAKLQAALYLPADYEPGRKYPTLVYIYEKLSQRANFYWMPTANGFNKSVYTSQGYAVLMPDIVYEVDDPGMSAVWSVLPALDAAIETGVVDPEAVGLHGHSWGGYQTSQLITQTDRFTAAVAGAPLTNMISMYALIYKNSGGGNGAIFESSQGRFTGGPWDVPEAYVRNSPVYHAAAVTTPLIILHNDQDGAVDFTQGVEYYNTLRRLNKNVVMLQYVGENHGLRKPANRKDYTVRMQEFFDHYLRDLGMPAWLEQGVPYLDLEEHLESRAQAIADEIKKALEATRRTMEATEGGSGSQ